MDGKQQTEYLLIKERNLATITDSKQTNANSILVLELWIIHGTPIVKKTHVFRRRRISTFCQNPKTALIVILDCKRHQYTNIELSILKAPNRQAVYTNSVYSVHKKVATRNVRIVKLFGHEHHFALKMANH